MWKEGWWIASHGLVVFFLLWGEGNKKNIEMQKCKKKLRHMLHIIIYETLSGATFFFYLILQASKRPYGM